jgi:4-amino-4-deoxy-L-arabinose transferase-like glycosyltransferase
VNALEASVMRTSRDSAPSAPLDRAGVAIGVMAGFGLFYAFIARVVLEAFPFAGDEYSVALQAKLFAHGLLKAPAPPHAEWVGVDHVVIDDWVRSKYPPGEPALLALGERLGAAWVINPILAVATLAIVWLTFRRVLGARRALVGLVALGLAPLFAFHAGSFFSHTAAGLFLAIAFAAVARWLEEPRVGREGASAALRASDGWFVLCGAALGCGFLVRPFDAFLFGVAMLSLRSVRAIVITAVSALPFVGLNLVYQNAQFGSPFRDGYGVYEPTLRAIYGGLAGGSMLSLGCLVDPLQTWFHIDVLRAFLLEWTIPGTALVALLGAYSIGKDDPARRLRGFSLALIALSVAALLFTKANPDDGARPRYLAPILVPVVFLAAAGFAPACGAIEARFGALVQRCMVVIALLFGIGQLASFMQGRVPQIWKREGVFKATEALGVRDAVVVVRSRFPTQYARNGPWFDGILYLSVPPTTTAAEVATAYPGRPVWEAFEEDPWREVRVR